MVILPGCQCCASCEKCIEVEATGYAASGACRILVDLLDSIDGMAAFPVSRSASGNIFVETETINCSALFDWGATFGGQRYDVRIVLTLPAGGTGTATMKLRIKSGYYPWEAWWLVTPLITVEYEKEVTSTPLEEGGDAVVFTDADIVDSSGSLSCGEGGEWTFSRCRCACGKARYMSDFYWSGTCGSWWDVVELGGGGWQWVRVVAGDCAGGGDPPEVSGRPLSRRTKACVCDTGDGTPSLVESGVCLWSGTPATNADGAIVAVLTLNENGCPSENPLP